MEVIKPQKDKLIRLSFVESQFFPSTFKSQWLPSVALRYFIRVKSVVKELKRKLFYVKKNLSVKFLLKFLLSKREYNFAMNNLQRGGRKSNYRLLVLVIRPNKMNFFVLSEITNNLKLSFVHV